MTQAFLVYEYFEMLKIFSNPIFRSIIGGGFVEAIGKFFYVYLLPLCPHEHQAIFHVNAGPTKHLTYNDVVIIKHSEIDVSKFFYRDVVAAIQR